MGETMQTDSELEESIVVAKEIVRKIFADDYRKDEEIEKQLSDILHSVLRYCLGINSERSLQIDQIENNIDELRHLLRYSGEKKHISAAINHLDNLIRYSGAVI